jgi:hypothetical protein
MDGGTTKSRLVASKTRQPRHFVALPEKVALGVLCLIWMVREM